MIDGALYPLAQAREIYRKLVAQLGNAVQLVTAAGSVRREKAYVHDLDVVVWANYRRVGQAGLFDDDLAMFHPVDLMTALNGMVEMKPKAKIVRFAYLGIPVELYLAERDGNNYEALLQMRTGSAEFNASLASRARRMGMEYRAGYGLWAMGRRVDDGTERGVFAALNLAYLSPDQRR
jgi:DNA polymerase/3'-5' exonuclease PolX